MRICHSLPAAIASGLLLGLAPVAAQPQAGALMFEGDLVRGRPQAGATGATCVLANQYKRGESVVWRIRVLDPRTGQQLDDKGVKELKVELADGQKFDATFGPHPKGKPTDTFWATSWAIPADYPTGTVAYKIVATDLEGRTHSWEPFKVAPSQLTVIPGAVEYVR